jgi:hypothetical protein
MIIRVELKDIESSETNVTKHELLSKKPIYHACLSQNKAFHLGCTAYVLFWYLDDSTPINDIEALKSKAGVHSITVLPNNTNPYTFTTIDEWKNLSVELIREYGQKTQ